MATERGTDRSEAAALRARLAALEREQAERTARANRAIAAAQDKSYWLDRWHLDLNALMRGRFARELRVAVRALQAGLRATGQRRELRARLIGGDATAQADPFARSLSPDLLHAAPVTNLLHERLSPEDLATIDAGIGPDERQLRETADPVDAKRITLALAAHNEVTGALERTGLSSAMPGADVASMARGALAAGGSYYYADLVSDALGATGFELQQGQLGLDFGCSSGRIVRVLAAAHPEVEWNGCDPNAGAVDWARGHLRGIRFEHSPEAPPLPYADESFDFAYAISIWSHFSERMALAWLDEMHRVVRPRGRLLLTTHGEHSVSHTHLVGQRAPEQLAAIREALRERGLWYAAEYADSGDHGIANPDWGIAFLSAEWLLAKTTPRWRVGLFHAGRVEANQDLYVLERR